jgi:hypothetical protein
MNAVALQQPAIPFSDFPGDMAVPPIGCETVGAIVGFGGFNRDVIRALEPDDVRGLAGDAGVPAAVPIRDK